MVRSSLFISYYPLKQGLKPALRVSITMYLILFISYYPLKQGLKLQEDGLLRLWEINIYILLSIKTRIETKSRLSVFS